MSQYGITDIKMRMLKISELKLIMGFPEDYILIGNQTEQKKFIGNAVEVNMARVLCEALYKSLTPMFSTKAAI
jgi:DNA (cytosine-5)-methyltransferase 1